MSAIQTLKQRAYIHVRRQVLAGTFGSGGRVSEWALSRELGMSRGPVREAVNQLISEGLLVQQPGFGTFVRRAGRAEVIELCDLRLALEVAAADRAARRLTSEQAVKLDGFMADMERIGADVIAGRRPYDEACYDDMFAADHGIHDLILRAARAPLIRRMAETAQVLGLIRQRSPAALRLQIEGMPDQLAIHRELVEAVKSRDPRRARRVMGKHLRHVRNEIVKLMAMQQPVSGAFVPDGKE
jgi:DNA-binding GntR family transcriptional regulator